MIIELKHKRGPLYNETRWKDTKDPCPVFDGNTWHIFGSGGSVIDEKWQILHATAEKIEGPWKEEEPCILEEVTGEHVAAPGVVFDFEEKKFHMFVQTNFLSINGTVEHLVSEDGHFFKRQGTALTSLPDTEEAGIYDPHPSIIGGEKYVVYSGTPRIIAMHASFLSEPDIFLAKSVNNTWAGPWERMGKILDHTEISMHHNQKGQPEYEWGIEGPQLIELPNKMILLNATCFLPEGRFGTRQRVFFATASSPIGPYTSLGPVVHSNLQDWESGENGHAAAILSNDQTELLLFYQARSMKETKDAHLNDWRYGLATFDITGIKIDKRKKVDLN